jgi:hypothetical protein
LKAVVEVPHEEDMVAGQQRAHVAPLPGRVHTLPDLPSARNHSIKPSQHSSTL